MTREQSIVPTKQSRATDVDYSKNPTDLFKAIEEKKWDDILATLRSDPTQASKWVLRKGKDGTITWRRLPLHEACIRKPSDAVMTALIKAYPRAVRATDSYGRLPLHHACVHGCSVAIIDQLLMAYPESIDVSDVWGKTPLLNAQASTSPNKDNIIEALEKRPSHYAVRVAELKQKAAEEKQREAFANAFENKFRDAQRKHAVIVTTLEEALTQLRAESNEMKNKYNNSLSIIENLEAQVKLLKTENNELSDKVADQTAAADVLEEKEQKLRDEAGQMNATKTELLEKIVTLERKVEDDESAIDLLKKNLKEMEDSTQRTITQLEEKMAGLQSEKDATETILNRERVSLENELEGLRKEVRELSSKNHELEDKNVGDTEELNALRAAVAENDEEIQSLSEKLQDVSDAKAAMEERVDEMEDEISALAQRKDELEAHFENESVAHASLKGESAADKVEIFALEKNVAELTESNLKLNQQLKEMSFELRDAKQSVEKVRAEMEEKDHAIAMAQDVTRADKALIKALETDVVNLKKDRSKLEKSEAELSERLSIATAKISVAVNDHDRLSEHLASQEKKIQSTSIENLRLVQAAAKQEDTIRAAAAAHEIILKGMTAANEQMKLIEAARLEHARLMTAAAKQEDGMRASMADHDLLVAAVKAQKASLRNVHSELSSIKSK